MSAASMFFFSSRRRHTRLQGDWSSDVCSSDLAAAAVAMAWETRIRLMSPEPRAAILPRPGAAITKKQAPRRREPNHRSEERRVGKEGRCGWQAEEEKEQWQTCVGQRSDRTNQK